MSEENVDQAEEIIEEQPLPPPPRKRTFFSKRNFFVSFGALALILFFVGLGIYISYRFGYFDNYIKAQFVAKMDEIGVVFDADVFRIQAAPLTLQLKNATFNDKLTGEKLFRIGEANLGLSVKDLYAWQLSRDISIDSTDLQDVEAWVKFDADGKSNFSNLKLVEREEKSRVNFTYSSIKFSLKEGLVHFGDISRKINANAKNVNFFLEPENYQVPDDQKRYKFDFASTDSNFTYDEKTIDPINIKTKGIADDKGAEITQLTLTSPLGENNLHGTLTDWKSPKYNLNVESNIDLMQVQTFLPNGTALRGIGNFKGTVTGEGEKYKIDGEITSDALAANNIRLKALQVNAVVEGENSMYNANGKAVAEMLTFNDFKIDFPQLIGNVRGTGTDFKWVGELQAAAVRKSTDLSIAGLFLSDAVAEFKDKKLEATVGKARIQDLLLASNEFKGFSANNAKVSVSEDSRNISAPNITAQSLKTKAFNLNGVTGRNAKVSDNSTRTEVSVASVQAQSGDAKDTKIKDVTANDFRLTRQNNTTNITAKNVNAAEVNAKGAKIANVTASQVNFQDTPNETTVYSDTVRVAKVETNVAVLGSLNVAGVRLKIVAGRIEGTSGDINAGSVAITKSAVPDGGKLENVKFAKPVFVLEPSGRYRASSDMSLGGGILGSVNLGAARATVVATNDQIALNNLNANVMDGNVNGNAVIATNNRNQSRVDADFTNLDLAKLLALQGGKVVPVEGQTTGKVNLTFPGTNIKSASGTLTADFNANAGTAERGLVPVNGKLGLRATNGLFDIDFANLNTEKSKFEATGRFDLDGANSNLNLALNSTDAGEIDRIIRVLNLSPELEEQLNSYQAQFAGNLAFSGTLTGNVTDPTIDGKAQLDSISLKGREIGSLAANILVSPAAIEVTNGKLQQGDGGNIAFNVKRTGADNNISVQATLDRVNTGNLLAALPVQDSLPEGLRDFNGQTSGTINLTGLPNSMSGSAQLKSTGGSVGGQSFDSLEANVAFQGTLVNIEKFDARFGEGFLSAKGTVSTDTKSFNLEAEGKNIEVARVIPLFTKDTANLPQIDGTVDLSAKLTGEGTNFPTYNINFKGVGQNVAVNQTALGTINFEGTTADQKLNANITANFENQPQVINATLNFGDENLPFKAETVFNQTELAPYVALLKPPENVTVTGKATGRIFIEGNLYAKDANGVGQFTTGNLKGNANFSEFGIQVNETPFAATQPLIVSFNPNQIVVESGKFAGGGSNVVIDGAIALNENSSSNLTVNGKVNLRVFDVISKNTFFGGLADLSVRLVGSGTNARLTGSASLENSSFSTFIGNERINLTSINGQVLFTSNQVQINQLDGKLGGGKIIAKGGAVLSGLQLERFRFDITGQNVTAPLMEGFIATADTELEVSGYREGGDIKSRIAGTVLAKRSVYTKDIDLADIVSNRRTGSISAGTGGGSSFLGVPQLDLRIEGRDALIVRNNIADLRASASLRVGGDFQTPIVSGRITASQGTIFFRNDRYEVQRGFLEFPPDTDGEPVINLQAETDIQGYQVIVNLVGNLSNTETLAATVRSSPALPQADVISLITTGNLSNTDTGIPTLAQSGINTAAEVIADSLINDPLRKATDKLFGLNKFEIDPLISGKKLNPSARLTVGRQINRNLAITYSTNLSEDQNQVLALEYRVSNRLSFVAQYEQRSLSNVTRNNNNFSFEIRLRKRF